MEAFVAKIAKFVSKWVVLEPLMIMFMISFMKNVTRQNVFLDKIGRDDFNLTVNSSRDNGTIDGVQNATSTFIS